MSNYELVEITLECPYCGENYTTTMWTYDCMPYEFCCREDCYDDYHSVQKVRERKLQSILECTTTTKEK